ncbi:MAG: RIP metalloprotease RseP [Hyphomicrobiaceae bacterium]|nr:RIP metalloprotease RseP [Hyphomicrobiaceae bacterium]
MASISSFLSVVLPFLGVLTLVVFIHELGHFLVARWCGVKVAAFSIGFGPEIVGFNDRHGTRWRLAWIPLGGYVRFIDDETAASTSHRDALDKLSSEDRKGAFQTQPVGNRALVVAAGPAFNIISAVIIYAATFWLIGTYSTAAIVDEVIPDSAAAQAGIKPGDKVVEIAGKPVQRFSDLQRIVSQSAGSKLEFVIDRDGKLHAMTIAPELKEITDPIGNKVQVGVIGIKRVAGNDRWEHTRHGLLDATGMAFAETGYVSWQIISSLPKLPGAIMKTLGGQRQSEIGGPIAIAEMTAHASKSGIGGLLGWIAVFSIMLGIMNLLPIPVLDGGHLVFYALEAIRGRPLDERKQELGFRIGLAILATMMFAALFGDIMRKLGIG